MSSATPELNTAGNEIVRAGAGAGKTTELTNQVIQRAEAFYLSHGEMPRMIVTTFTRKATQELRERLMVRALESKKPHLIEFVNSKAHLYVSTIHGVLEIYLKRFGAPLAIDPNFIVLNRTEAAKLSRKALREVLFKTLNHQELLETFDFKKLTHLCRQYHEMKLKTKDSKAHDLNSLYSALAELAHAITEQTLDLVETITAEANGPKADDWIKFAEALQSVAKITAQSSKKQDDWIMGREQALQILSSVKKPTYSAKSATVSEETSEQSKEVVKNLTQFIEQNDAESMILFAESFERFEKLASEFSEKFQSMKRDLGAIEISDLELLAGECIRTEPDSAKLFSEEWDHWLIDEYQDTSPFQVELLGKLVGERPVFIVGDPQQSIYLFRGARSEVFASKEKEILKNKGQLRFLEKNYRSRRELLLFFNDFFAGFTNRFTPMLSFQEKPLKKSEPVAIFFISQKPEKNSDAPIRDAEFAGIVSHVLGQLAKGEKPESICVLARTRATLVKIADLLDEAGVPVHLHASGGFYERREIQDALALLKFLVNPHDNHNLLVLLRSPWFRVDDDALVHAIRKAQESYWTVLSKIETEEFESIARLKQYLANRNSLGVSACFRQGLIEAGFVDASRIHDSSGRRESNIWKLLSKLTFEEGKPGFNPLQFILNTYAELRDFEGSEEGDAVTAVEPNRVNLMTIHASKGLAFDQVILPCLDESPRLSTHYDFLYDEKINRWSMRIPIGPELQSTGSVGEKLFLKHFREQELQEHQRVLYVALTRARHSVFLSWTEPAGKNSWLEQLRFDVSEGVHQSEEYSYIVTREIPSAQNYQVSKNDQIVIRDVWSKKISAQSVQQTSVTQILESNSKVKYGGGNFLNKIWTSAHGSAVHKLMEMMKYRSEVQIKKLIQQWFPNRVDEVVKAVEWMGALSEPPVTKLISQGEVEWSFAFKQSGRLIEGQVDLWGKDSSVTWIVDYKTGSPEQYQKAFSQMELYSLALRRAGLVKANEEIKIAAVYPFSEKIFVKSAPAEADIIAAFFADQSPGTT